MKKERKMPARLAWGLVGALALVSGLWPALARAEAAPAPAAAPAPPAGVTPATPGAGIVTPTPVAVGRGAATAMGSMPVTLSLRDVPLRTALETLFTGSGLQHAVEQAVPNYPITLDMHDVPFSTALRTLLRLAPGVALRKEGDVYVIGMKQPPAEQTAAEPETPQPDQTNAAAELQYEKAPLNFQQYQVMAYVLGGQPVPTEVDLQGGGGYGGIGGYGGGGLGGYGGGVGGYGGSLGGYGGIGGGLGTTGGYVGPVPRRF